MTDKIKQSVRLHEEADKSNRQRLYDSTRKRDGTQPRTGRTPQHQPSANDSTHQEAKGMNITLNIDSRMFYEKPQGTEIAAIRKRLGKGKVNISTDELINHVELGKSFTPAAMDGTTGNTWKSQQVIVADIDNETAQITDADGVIREIEPIKSNEAANLCESYGITPFFMYHTFSNSDEREKYRIVLITDQAITDKQEAAELTARFANIFNRLAPGAADTTMSDAARLIFGGKPGCTFNITEQVTPLQVLRALPPLNEQSPQQLTLQEQTAPNTAEPTTAASDPDGLDFSWIQQSEKQRQLDWLQQWADRHGVILGKRYEITQPPHEGATVICVVCPWKHLHGETTAPNESVIFVEKNGQLGYLCRHAHCTGKKWQDYRAEIERRTSSKTVQDTPQERTERPQSDLNGDQATAADQDGNGAENANTGDDLEMFLDKVQTEAYKPHATGLPFLDKLLDGGIISQTLLTILAAPSAGKTTLCAQIAETLAEHETPVLYFNLEMSAEQMIAKAISARLQRKNICSMSMTDVLQGYKWTDEQARHVMNELETYRRTNYRYIRYSPAGVGTDINNILQYLDQVGTAALNAGRPAPAVVLDYLHLLTGGNDDLQERIKIAVKGLKDYACKYDTFVICITAISKDDMNKGKITLASGRDSSNIPYTADVQISLNYYEIDDGKVTMDNAREMERLQTPLTGKRDMILRVLKNRFGTQGRSVRVDFDAAHNIFYRDADRVDFEEVNDSTTFDDDIIMTI